MKYIVGIAIVTFLFSCNNNDGAAHPSDSTGAAASDTSRTATGGVAFNRQPDTLPPPFATKSAENYCKVIGWPDGKSPIAPAGFTVTKFAGKLDNPRFIYIADNGDVFVSEANTEVTGIKKVLAPLSSKSKSQNLGKSANRITLFRNYLTKNPQSYTFLTGLNKPFGMLIIGNHFYVANTDGLMEYDYHPGDTAITTPGGKILSLPAGGYNNHWTRNIVTNEKKDKIYISVGSGSNVAEHGMANEVRRADILEVGLDGTGEKIYASGLRNPAGLNFQPGTGVLWTAVNERDELGDDLVPDYITSVREGGFYGWPWSYFGQHPDPRMKAEPRPDMVQKAIVPDYPVGAHTASLGLCFYSGASFPGHYQNGAFVGQHGSWNRSELVGYKVVFVPFQKGRPAGNMEDFLTGFIADASKKEVYGRPVSVAVMHDGSLLVADDSGNTIWRVSANG
ncbi:MAG: sorbosone dehydrogenase family protein [Bacteroidetes bacterium]|nr:sorbosone dehydrogenase family protein [Bacteroidota bacterium]